ncbi:hypothetical protein [Halovivax gelatinilyticus]|uniref:hypothetical protein n=1 Tax=Halovivax gelatinilyticus TaxID=2961597 RepID=UPI0020CA7F65|nr:hypothetical protein [Halovivax gelatinilyticus]
MSPRRRTLLTALGATVLGRTGVAYWNRRAIRRRDEVNAIETALDVPVPTIADPVEVTDAHLEAAHEWAKAHVSETDELVGTSDDPEYNRLENARAGLDAHPPAEIGHGDERHDALNAYRLSVASSATARGHYLEPDSGRPSDELRAAHESLGDELETFERRYAGEALTQVVVQGAHAEERLGAARSSHSRADDYLADDSFSNPVAWETVETGRYAVHDADRFFATIDGDEDRTDDFQNRYEALDDLIESETADLEWEYESDVDSQAYDRWIDVHLSNSGDLDEPDDTDRPARTVRTKAERATVARALSDLDHVPGWRELAELDVVLLESTDDLADEKRAAVDSIEAARETVGSDPLGVHLLRAVSRLVGNADTTLDRLRSDVTEYDTDEWQNRLDRALLNYRSAAAEASAVPEIVDVVDDGE